MDTRRTTIKTRRIKFVEKLKNKIPKKEAKIRDTAFNKAAAFIENGPYQAVDRIISKTFKVPDTEQERVDLEIQKGIAFINQAKPNDDTSL